MESHCFALESVVSMRQKKAEIREITKIQKLKQKFKKKFKEASRRQNRQSPNLCSFHSKHRRFVVMPPSPQKIQCFFLSVKRASVCGKSTVRWTGFILTKKHSLTHSLTHSRPKKKGAKFFPKKPPHLHISYTVILCFYHTLYAP